jgi:membrane-associated phospholipid phosphatase
MLYGKGVGSEMRSMMRRIHLLEIFSIAFLGSLVILVSLFYARFPNYWHLLLGLFSLIVLAWFVSQARQRCREGTASRFVCDFSPVFFVIASYEILGGIVPYLRPDVDHLLITVDYALFGVYPTVWLERFFTPWLADVLALAYCSYYFIPLILLVVLYFRGTEEEFTRTSCIFVLGYYLSYAGYILMPAIGPRFTLASLQQVPLQGGSILYAVVNTLNTLEGNLRDCFPSGHTQIVLIALWLAFLYKRPLFWIYLPVSMLLIFSTVYLRYHYVIDVAAGFAFAGMSVPFGTWVWERWARGLTDRSGRSCIASRPGPLSPSA